MSLVIVISRSNLGKVGGIPRVIADDAIGLCSSASVQIEQAGPRLSNAGQLNLSGELRVVRNIEWWRYKNMSRYANTVWWWLSARSGDGCIHRWAQLRGDGSTNDANLEMASARNRAVNT